MSLRLAFTFLLWVIPARAQVSVQQMPPPPLRLLAWDHPASGVDARFQMKGRTPPVFSSERFGPTLGGGLLGAAIGGGVGLLLGTLELEVPDDDHWSSSGGTDEYSLPMPILGLWTGSTIGVLAGAGAEPNGTSIVITVIGSAFGSLAGAITAGALTRSDWGTGHYVGAVVGAGFGGVCGLAVAEGGDL